MPYRLRLGNLPRCNRLVLAISPEPKRDCCFGTDLAFIMFEVFYEFINSTECAFLCVFDIGFLDFFQCIIDDGLIFTELDDLAGKGMDQADAQHADIEKASQKTK